MYYNNSYNNYSRDYIPVEPKYAMPDYSKENLVLKEKVLTIVKPFVKYGIEEKKYTDIKHAITEVSAITYLIGKGYEPYIAHKIVESWETNEKFNF